MKDEKLINEQIEEQFRAQHTEWLRHPITSAYLKALNKHRESFVGIISANVANVSVTDQQIRMMGISVRDFDTAIVLVSNPEAILNLNKNQKV